MTCVDNSKCVAFYGLLTIIAVLHLYAFVANCILATMLNYTLSSLYLPFLTVFMVGTFAVLPQSYYGFAYLVSPDAPAWCTGLIPAVVAMPWMDGVLMTGAQVLYAK